ncbi:30S ribosomal protein S12 methylthiotransferase RimO [Nocardiopsis sp. N85]|uniref:30S ribosomal protein S12 methylthiotransferase RimO n=1 Tax=Nocardiopsis sp. N85 TaxID=3029400 RepID=UPI00237FCB0A|nr:30S ribosomal protein S12 methylthiotransferase RimO [Nocardiopsis sp. N85]MDE3720022.1 30S ribosomal protein S12 methylthiotransferase RimO [Nocardiopsis sp. N85]
MSSRRTVSLVTLGCARNEVDSEELAGRLSAGGWELVDGDAKADVTLVNTCGFIDAAKQDSIESLLEAAENGGKVVAAGCMAERYGSELADALPEAQVIGFDDYAAITDRLDDVVEGRPLVPHTPRDRRTLLPISPVERDASRVHVPGHGAFAESTGADGTELPYRAAIPRRRLTGGPVANLKIASGCDRRCTFCAIPTFRGAYISRHPDEIVREAEWLASEGVREVFLVSENSTSYGKDLGDVRALERLLPRLAAVEGLDRVRVSYLQPAEVRPGLVDVLTGTPGVVPYFDLSFQHASGTLLRRMRRFGDRERFLELLDTVRSRVPEAGARSNFIVGFPGETEAEFEDLVSFLESARLDAIGVFGYSDEDGTEAKGHADKVPEEVVAERVDRLNRLAEELMAQRAEERLGDEVTVLVETVLEDGAYEGRSEHQAPEVDGSTILYGEDLAVGDLVRATVVQAIGADLVAEQDEDRPDGEAGER